MSEKFFILKEKLRDYIFPSMNSLNIDILFLRVWTNVGVGRGVGGRSFMNFIPDLNEGDYYDEEEKET